VSLCLLKNDWAALEKACRKLLKNPARRKSLGTAARNYAKKTFGINKLISRYLALVGLK
jgi:glycosyltransferase involved in cell wall biosynthesis